MILKESFFENAYSWSSLVVCGNHFSHFISQSTMQRWQLHFVLQLISLSFSIPPFLLLILISCWASSYLAKDYLLSLFVCLSFSFTAWKYDISFFCLNCFFSFERNPHIDIYNIVNLRVICFSANNFLFAPKCYVLGFESCALF